MKNQSSPLPCFDMSRSERRFETKTGREDAEFFHSQLVDSGRDNQVWLQVAAHRYDQVIKDAYERGRKAGWREGMKDGLKISLRSRSISKGNTAHG